MAPRKKTVQSSRDLILGAADEIIAKVGISGFNARAISVQSGCAMGSINYIFGSLDGLLLVLNEQTLTRMGHFMFERARDPKIGDAVARLHALASGYFDYAVDNRHYWDALFAVPVPDGKTLPVTYVQTRQGLIDGIVSLFDASITIPPEGPQVLARTLYEAVHGIVTLGLTSTLGGSHEDVRARLGLLLRMMVG